jgi:hypothetical protein
MQHMELRRAALILTDRRLIELTISHPTGTVPSEYNEFSLKVRSFFPGQVHGGSISSAHAGNLSASIVADAGKILIL